MLFRALVFRFISQYVLTVCSIKQHHVGSVLVQNLFNAVLVINGNNCNQNTEYSKIKKISLSWFETRYA